MHMKKEKKLKHVRKGDIWTMEGGRSTNYFV